ncbi:MAG: phenylalanine 4-monooxygenase [Alphaproteobacteria bacterium]|nr:phenylalanine 4-monooxygenase [Alphaproteobacteria bacterium]
MTQAPQINPSANPFEANTSHALRGNYAAARADYTVAQPFDDYAEEEHARWRFLYDRQRALLPGYAAPEYLAGLEALNAADGIPRLEDANEVLRAATGWELVAVPGLIPDGPFFDHLANRRFPVAHWIRRADEMDYLVEPDIFHDFFGHVPLLSNPTFAAYMEKYGRGGPKAIQHGATKMLARLYWYIVEFGLIETPKGLRAFGAGMLSSQDETIYSVESAKPHRVRFELERVLRTEYMVDDFQKTYFVVDSFERLFEECDRDFADIYDRLQELPSIKADEVLDTDDIVNRGTVTG